MAATETAPPARLKTRYLEEIRPALVERFGYTSVMQAPRIEKITLNMGVGMAKQDNKMLRAATEQLATIAGQQPSVRRARKSIAAFKLREGMPVGLSVTLRAERGYEFLDRLVSIAIPRIRDFRGLNPRSFDGRGNYSMGVKEQIIFPEVDYDAVDQVRGLDITITTSAKTDVEAYALLSAMGMPFANQGRPKGFDLPGDEPSTESGGAAGATVEHTREQGQDQQPEAEAAEALAAEVIEEEIVAEAVEELVAEELVAELEQELVAEAVEELVAEEIVAEVAEELVAEAAQELTAEAALQEESAQEPAAEAEQVAEPQQDDDPAEKESTD